jgi:hypothetical protein
MSDRPQQDRPESAEPPNLPGTPDGAGPTDPAEAESEDERLRRKLGLTPLEWALSGSFAERRGRREPLVIPGFGDEPGGAGEDPPSRPSPDPDVRD